MSALQTEEGQIKYGELLTIGMENRNFLDDISVKDGRFSCLHEDFPTAVMPSRYLRVASGQKAPSREIPGHLGPANQVRMGTGEKQYYIQFTSVLDKDMFQIGRGISSRNKFRIDCPTVSRYSSRIVIERRPPFTARIYAGGFDDKGEIFLNPEAPVGEVDNQPDGLITNGIFVLAPPKCGMAGAIKKDVDEWKPEWREVSVCGRIFNPNRQLDRPFASGFLKEESNVFVDGTIIDIGGVALVWRTAIGCILDTNWIKNALTAEGKKLIDPVNVSTMFMSNVQETQMLGPHVYLGCGHVVAAMDEDGKRAPPDQCRIPGCQKSGKLVPLKLSLAPFYYYDCGRLEYCFNPCGHVVNETTGIAWSKIKFRRDEGTNEIVERSLCPFCNGKLDDKEPYFKLKTTYVPQD